MVATAGGGDHGLTSYLPPLQVLGLYVISDVACVFVALRPFRLIDRVPALQILVKSLLQSLKSLGTLFGVLIFCALTFACMGVQLFKVRWQAAFPPSSAASATNPTRSPLSQPPRLARQEEKVEEEDLPRGPNLVATCACFFTSCLGFIHLLHRPLLPPRGSPDGPTSPRV